MRITVIRSLGGQNQDQRTQQVAEVLIAGIRAGITKRPDIADTATLLEPFADLGDETASSLAARLKVFVVTRSLRIASGETHREEVRHAINSNQVPKSLGTDEHAPKGAVVATFVIDDVMAVRHEIEQKLVTRTIEESIEDILKTGEKMRTNAANARAAYEADVAKNGTSKKRIPDTDAEIERFLMERIARERDVYAKVRVIELIGRGRPKDPFYLVYGDQPDDATGEKTGGFPDLERAKSWFTGKGR